MKKVNITHVNNEHNRWLRSLDFYKTEINILKGILTEIAGKNTSPEVMKQVEHFENQFKVQIENIDTMAHNIHVNITTIGKEAQQSKTGYIDGSLLSEHTAFASKFDKEEQIITALIHSFRTFAEEWM